MWHVRVILPLYVCVLCVVSWLVDRLVTGAAPTAQRAMFEEVAPTSMRSFWPRMVWT